MAKEVKSKRYQGVYYRELENGDRSYFLRVRLDGKVKRIPIGKKSAGITEQFCNQEKNRILNAHRFGEDAAAQLQKVKREDPAFIDLLNYYLDNADLKPKTKSVIRYLRNVPFANEKKVSRADIQKYVDEQNRKYRPATVHNRYRQIKSVYKFAIIRGKYRYENPCENIALPKGIQARQRYFTVEEIQQLLDAVRPKKRLYIFVKLAICTGARLSTLIQIHQKDIKPDGSVRLYNSKLDRYYTGYLDAETMELLKDRDGYVLARRGRQDKPPGAQSIQRPVLKIIDELFNPPGTPQEMKACIHTLRHSLASRLLDKDVPMEVIAKVLDHSSPVITSQVYAKVRPEKVRGSVEGIWD